MQKKFTFIYLVFVTCLLAACATKKPTGNTTPSASDLPLAVSYSNADDYETQRQKLVQKDSLLSFEGTISLSEKEEAANQKLIALREEMIAYYDSVHFFPPAHHFFKSKEHIYSTKLYKILKKIPKGGIQHLHPNAGGSYRWIVERALQEPHCYVYWQPDNKQYIKGQIHFFKDGKVPAGFYPIKALNDTVKAFPDQLYTLLTFDKSMMGDSVDIWGEFERRFQRVGGFTSYQPVFEDLCTATFDSLAADGVQHVEARTHLGGSLYDLEHPAGSFPGDSVISYYQRAVQRVRTTREPDFTFKLIYTNIRFHPLEKIKEDLVTAFKVRQRHPDVVVAYDLVAHEDKGHTTQFYRDAWLMRDSLAKVYGIDMPLSLHDGESSWEHISNVYDAAMLNSKRIGHGFNLAFFPTAEEMVQQQNICVEVSPLSNQILGYVKDLRIHPAHSWIKRGIQISINPDDPGIFDYVGVTPDYWSVFLAWELDLRDLKKLAINSITYSFLSAKEKEQALAAWEKKWNSFIDNLNTTF
ncbi:hypothetical protein ACFSKU_12920 [Pontibacter silvestris]|uniref:adenosine deaminase n=1 Tax=Pontibacter silvestris TaxID=2305183 RepID=A0ABW4X075_9BACT|nr:hypothetical protein [Pontibacter silvestris]MCC9135651.1 hypothetical protein [Pontibacter silvestris]